MFETLRRWQQQRVLKSQAIPDALWRDSLESLPFLAIYTDDEVRSLREKVVLFLHAKNIVGARGHRVTPRQRVVIALQACVLILNHDLSYYDGWQNIIIYPDEFVPGWEWEDEAGVVHRNEDPMAGEAILGGPVVLSWADVEASSDWTTAGMNLAIHEFAHKVMPGFGEQMRQVSLKYVPTAILSRQVGVIRGGTLILNLPGQPKAIKETLDGVFPAVPYCIDLIGGPYIETNEAVIKAFRPKSALRPRT